MWVCAIFKYMATVCTFKNSHISFWYMWYIKCILTSFTISPSGDLFIFWTTFWTFFGTFLLVSRSSPNLLIKRVIFLPSMVDFGECSIQRCIHTLCNGLYLYLPVAYVPYKMHRYILPSYSFWRSFYLVNYTQDISGTFLLLSWYHFSSLIYKLYVIMRTIIYKGFY